MSSTVIELLGFDWIIDLGVAVPPIRRAVEIQLIDDGILDLGWAISSEIIIPSPVPVLSYGGASGIQTQEFIIELPVIGAVLLFVEAKLPVIGTLLKPTIDNIILKGTLLRPVNQSYNVRMTNVPYVKKILDILDSLGSEDL